MNDIMEKLELRDENVILNNNTYISQENMYGLLNVIKDSESVPSLLITPYLINVQELKIYELHYYEYDIEITSGLSEAKKYALDNNLPNEIIEGIIPGIIVNSKDYKFAVKELKSYLDSMGNMLFENIIKDYPIFSKRNLCYQIF